MLEKPVKQKFLVDVENYHVYWSGIVADVIEHIYKNAQTYISAYESNRKRVFARINGMLKVVPINLSSLLQIMYLELLPQFTPDDGPRRGVA